MYADKLYVVVPEKHCHVSTDHVCECVLGNYLPACLGLHTHSDKQKQCYRWYLRVKAWLNTVTVMKRHGVTGGLQVSWKHGSVMSDPLSHLHLRLAGSEHTPGRDWLHTDSPRRQGRISCQSHTPVIAHVVNLWWRPWNVAMVTVKQGLAMIDADGEDQFARNKQFI